MRVLSRGVGRKARFVALAVLATTLALSGAAKLGHAGNTPGVQVTAWKVLNDSTANILGQPSPGGNIGYDITVQNNGTSTTNHLVLSESIGTGGAVGFVQSTPANVCSGTSTLTCQVKQFSSGAVLHVIVLFATPSSPAGTNVVNTVAGSFDPQTTGPPNQRTTDTFGPCQDGLEPPATCSTTNGIDSVTRQYAGFGDASFAESLALANDPLAVTGTQGQKGAVKMPAGFVNTNPDLGTTNKYVGTTLTEDLDPSPTSICGTCLTYRTNVTMPAAPTFGTGGPFWDGASAQPFQVTITIPGALLSNSFKPTGVWHLDDATGAIPRQLQPCTYIGTTPQPQLTPDGICISSLVQAKKTKDVTAVGWALSNGSYWIG